MITTFLHFGHGGNFSVDDWVDDCVDDCDDELFADEEVFVEDGLDCVVVLED